MIFKRNLLILSLVIIFFDKGINHVYSSTELQLAGLKLGASTQELTGKYKGIYKHKLMMGEHLYEACNQKDLIVTTFTENPWTPGLISVISIRKVKDVSICRDKTGSLPDFSISPKTPAGLKIGDSEKDALKLYGNPKEKCSIGPESVVWRYPQKVAGLSYVHFTIVFEDKKVESLGLFAEIEGRVNPFYKDGIRREVKCNKPI